MVSRSDAAERSDVLGHFRIQRARGSLSRGLGPFGGEEPDIWDRTVIYVPQLTGNVHDLRWNWVGSQGSWCTRLEVHKRLLGSMQMLYQVAAHLLLSKSKTMGDDLVRGQETGRSQEQATSSPLPITRVLKMKSILVVQLLQSGLRIDVRPGSRLQAQLARVVFFALESRHRPPCRRQPLYLHTQSLQLQKEEAPLKHSMQQQQNVHPQHSAQSLPEQDPNQSWQKRLTGPRLPDLAEDPETFQGCSA